MKNHVNRLKLARAIALVSFFEITGPLAGLAQESLIPVADDTLGLENSQVEAIDDTTSRINGGAVRGPNLFHSFSEFNVGEGRAVYFANPVNVINIFSRVTGNNPSNIFGTLGVEGPANLLLLNPNGVLFGPEASLDLQGSFLTTTADAVLFGAQGSFSATDPTSPPLLNVQPSALFLSQLAAQRNAAIRSEAELGVNPGQILFFVGGDIVLDGGQLNARNGRVELVGVSEGVIDLVFGNNSLNLSVPDGLNRNDVVLTNGSRVDVLGVGRGSIAVYGENIEISETSKLLAGTATNPPLSLDMIGDITLNATDSLVLTGAVRRGGGWDRSTINNTTSSNIVGSSGDIEITARSLQVTEGAEINTSMRGQGTAGDIIINTLDSVEILGGTTQADRFGESRVRAGVEGSATNAQGGNIVVNTRTLRAADGAYLTTTSNGEGDAGTVTIAAQTVEFSGDASNAIASGAYSRVFGGSANGQAGDIFVRADALILRGGGTLITNNSSFVPGELRNAGDITVEADLIVVEGRARQPLAGRTQSSTITSTVTSAGNGIGGEIRLNTRALEIRDGGQITAGTAGSSGNAGNIEVNADDYIFISGLDSGIFNELGNVQVTFDAPADTVIGDITIHTGRLEMRDEATIATATLQGDARDIRITAQDIQMFDSDIVAVALSASGGNIEISADRISLFGDSNLATFASFGEGRGGDVIIDANAVLAFDDSDIFAFAQNGQGGNVNLENVTAFFGENYQTASEGMINITGVDIANRSITFDIDGNDRVDINASGAVSGIITLPNISFIENSLTELPDTVVNTDQLIAGSCIARAERGGSFIVSGSGGLPDRPGDAFLPPYPTGEIRSLSGETAVDRGTSTDAIVEPQGVFQLADGQIVISRLCESE